MTDHQPPGAGWWLAADGQWYPPELHPDRTAAAAPVSPPPAVAGPAGDSGTDVVAGIGDQFDEEPVDLFAAPPAGDPGGELLFPPPTGAPVALDLPGPTGAPTPAPVPAPAAPASFAPPSYAPPSFAPPSDAPAPAATPPAAPTAAPASFAPPSYAPPSFAPPSYAPAPAATPPTGFAPLDAGAAAAHGAGTGYGPPAAPVPPSPFGTLPPNAPYLPPAAGPAGFGPPGAPPGMPPGMFPGMQPGVPPGVPPGAPPGMFPGMPAGHPPPTPVRPGSSKRRALIVAGVVVVLAGAAAGVFVATRPDLPTVEADRSALQRALPSSDDVPPGAVQAPPSALGFNPEEMTTETACDGSHPPAPRAAAQVGYTKDADLYFGAVFAMSFEDDAQASAFYESAVSNLDCAGDQMDLPDELAGSVSFSHEPTDLDGAEEAEAVQADLMFVQMDMLLARDGRFVALAVSTGTDETADLVRSTLAGL